MQKRDFVKAVVSGSETDLTVKDVEKVVEAVFREMGRTLSGRGRFAWAGFGTFTVRDLAARQGRNPQTGEAMRVEATRRVAFRAAPALKGGL
ncbi:MAG: HU family DNA-binding protein [Candidatus Tectomicrobia bacterium]|nr:HU family DNA-binding protein [Candidatus Tectomicrobia bacterium]